MSAGPTTETSASGSLQALQARFREVNGDHPMTPDDDAYVRARYQPAPESEYADMLAGRLPLPSYLLSDGTPMVPGDRLAPVEHAGGPEAYPDWFASHWPDDPDTAAREWAEYLSGRYVCLPSPSPESIRHRSRWTERVLAGERLLDADPDDIVGRSLISEAANTLDTLLAPMCGYDRLRFGGPQTPLGRERWVDGPRARLVTEPPALPLRTERLVMRPAALEDAPAAYRYYSDPEVSRYLLSEPLTLRETESTMRRRMSMLAPRADGDALALHLDLDGVLVGDVMLRLTGVGLVQAELGWTIDPAYGGRGIATEAANALIDLGFEHYRLHRVYAELDGRNNGSRRLCERLGMTQELHAEADFWSKGEWSPTYRFGLDRRTWAAMRDGGRA